MLLENLKVDCSQCHLPVLCSPAGLSSTELTKLDSLVTSWRRVELGQPLFSSGQALSALYAVQTGFFKTSVTTTDGREQVIGFHMAGEIIGLDGIADDRYMCDAIALEAAHVCVMPYTRICALGREIPALQKHLHKIMSREIVRQHNVMLLLGGMRAEERIAAFLLDLSRRMHQRGFSRSDLVLRMSRGEIGSYLGLKLETVSRAFSHLAEQGILQVKQRNVHIRDAQALGALLHTGAQMRDPSVIHN